MKKIQCKIEGITPLLMNKPKEYEGDSNVKIFNPNIDGDKELREKIYTIDGIVYQPATHIRGSLINAAKDLRIAGKGKSTYSKRFASMIVVEPEAIPHLFKEFDVHIVRTVNRTTKGQNMTKRPRLKKWALEFILEIDDEIPIDVLKEGLERAGKYIGIGDWRPATSGIHGKFMVTEFKKI